ncbi:hypothetical protein RIF29_26578 [Crotalaria pallida]|uniref:VQ domain-containing protein n=1 Tax=Crotalaria pallida TaxID=3830 RepID=A0AAN9EMV7_CROPI
MSDTSNNDPWMQFHQQQPLTDCIALDPTIEEGFSDAHMSSEKGILLSQGNNFSYTNSSSGHLNNPKGNNNNIAFKPIQKRSRASNKRTLTTLLNANTTNFRELVQEFTGCPPTPTTSMMSSFSNKGPITLNFQQGSKQQVNVHHNNTTTITSRIMPQLPQQQFLQEQQSGYYSNLEHVMKSSDFLQTTTVSNSRPSMEFSDGLLVENNDFGLHEFDVNAFSDDTKINDGFFMS